MDQKFEETDQQIEIFKFFEKSGNGSKKKWKPIKNMRKQINFKVLEKSGNGSKI